MFLAIQRWYWCQLHLNALHVYVGSSGFHGDLIHVWWMVVGTGRRWGCDISLLGLCPFKNYNQTFSNVLKFNIATVTRANIPRWKEECSCSIIPQEQVEMFLAIQRWYWCQLHCCSSVNVGSSGFHGNRIHVWWMVVGKAGDGVDEPPSTTDLAFLCWG